MEGCPRVPFFFELEIYRDPPRFISNRWLGRKRRVGGWGFGEEIAKKRGLAKASRSD